MVDEQQMFQALANIIKSKDIARLIKSLIIETDEGEYLLYGLYTIKKVNNFYQVSVGSDVKNVFSNLKTAVSWATVESKNNFMLASRIDVLDKSISSAEFNVDLYKKLYKKTRDTDMKVIYLNKLQDETMKRRKLARELDVHIEKIQQWQLKQFENQTSK